MEIKRAIIIVFDGLGAGELPDAAAFGDTGADTLDHTAEAAGKLEIPVLGSMGIGNIEGVDSIEPAPAPKASFGRMTEASPGKDTATGHWEMSGVILTEPFPTFPDGFPAEIMERFTEISGRGFLGNRPASGTAIMAELGEEHMRTGSPIVYTSADSVFQIAAHEGVVPIDELYRICAEMREFLYDYNVGRVIARPFIGVPGAFIRTPRRKDFSVEPPGETLLDRLTARSIPVVSIGKIGDIFVHRGTGEEIHTASDAEGMDATLAAMERTPAGLIFTNLVDFDTLYGHRNDPAGCARALERMDARLNELTGRMDSGDMLIITGDHGCDPTVAHTDHTREYAPLLVYGPGLKSGVELGTRATFADLGATIADALKAGPLAAGSSFLKKITP